MKATITFTGLDTWQMGRLIRAAERAGGIPEPTVHVDKATLDLWVTSNGTNRIQVIKAIRTITEWGLKEAKDFSDIVEREPAVLKHNVGPESAKRWCAILTEAGATVEMK